MNKLHLHILNGDATSEIFSKAGIAGQVMVWREVLVQGPLFYQIDTELFWEMRSQFMEIAFGAKLFEYKRKVIKEFQKLKTFQGEEITLWFEYDLFCQVNMIAILSYLLKNNKGHKISLVCVGRYKNHENLFGLGELKTEDYIHLFENRKILDKADLLDADRAWMAFCAKDLRRFTRLESDRFQYLKEAFMAAEQTFRKGSQLTDLELEILSIIESNLFTKRKLIGHLLKKDKILGFGDLQYEYILQTLGGYYSEEGGILKVNKV